MYSQPVDELGLSECEQRIVREVYCDSIKQDQVFVRDDVEDSVRGWLADAYFAYVTSKRDPQVLASFMDRLTALFDHAMVENLQETRAAATEMLRVPPDLRDTWPADRLPVLERVVGWAWGLDDSLDPGTHGGRDDEGAV